MTTQDKHTTEVVFRKYNDGQILALFPYEQAYDNFCESYLHIGQHGGANYAHCINSTKPATKEEYSELQKELEGMGYNLKVIKKRSLNRRK